LVAVCLALVGCGTVFEPTAATADGKKIPVEQVDAAGDRYEASANFKEAAQQTDPATIRRTFEQQYLAAAVHRLVIADAAEDLDIEVSDQEVEDQIAQIEAESGGEEEFRKALEERAITDAEVDEIVRSQLLENKIREEVTADAQPSEADVRQYFEEHIADFQQVRASHILVKASQADLAQQLASQLQAAKGAAREKLFARLAKQNSTDTASAKDGGDLGLAPPTQYVKPFAAAIGELEEGEVSDPVKTQFGFHVIYLAERITQPFAEVQGNITGQLAGEDANAAWGEYLKGRYEEADVRVNPRYGVLDLDSVTTGGQAQIVDTPPEDVPGADIPSPTGGSPEPASSPGG
jgi:foldase protein PrsA